MNKSLVSKTEEFVKQAFIENPHYSFNHWSVMYNHSVSVRDIALKIAEQVPCDTLVVIIGALLHDVGKTFKADPETLHASHEGFNLIVCKDFLERLGLPKDKLMLLEGIVSYNSDSNEMKIIKDADALALYSDKRLYTLYIEWAVQNQLHSSIQRKLDKFSELNFDISRKIGRKWFEQMKQAWEEYMKNH